MSAPLDYFLQSLISVHIELLYWLLTLMLDWYICKKSVFETILFYLFFMLQSDKTTSNLTAIKLMYYNDIFHYTK